MKKRKYICLLASAACILLFTGCGRPGTKVSEFTGDGSIAVQSSYSVQDSAITVQSGSAVQEIPLDQGNEIETMEPGNTEEFTALDPDARSDLTDEDLENVEEFDKEISKYRPCPFLSKNKKQDAIYKKILSLKSKYAIKDAKFAGDGIRVEFKSGIWYHYTFDQGDIE